MTAKYSIEKIEQAQTLSGSHAAVAAAPLRRRQTTCCDNMPRNRTLAGGLSNPYEPARKR